MNADAEGWPRTHRLTVDEYYRMAEVGVLAPGARVELIEGEVVDMAPIGSRHAFAVDLIAERLIRAAAGHVIVRIQGPVRLSARSEPQPDTAVLRRHEHRYAHAHPTAADVLLLVEVSDATLRFDRDVKALLYARHAVPEYWIVDLAGRRVHVLHEPREGRYTVEDTIDSGTICAHAAPLEMDLDGFF